MADYESTALTLPDAGQFQRDIVAINEFQKIVHANMVEGHDYGVIPGTKKPTLLKPGAEKIAKLLGLCDHYEIVDKVEDWDKPLFRYMIRCSLKTIQGDITISQGLGECNSMENKYRWRDAKLTCPECDQEGTIIKGKPEYGGGWICYANKGGCGAKWTNDDPEITGQKRGKVPNDDVYSIVNTILKMGKKRALVDAALSAGRLSDLFTQDIEELPGFEEILEGEVTPPTSPKPEGTKQSTTKQSKSTKKDDKATIDQTQFQEALKWLGITSTEQLFANLKVKDNEEFKKKFPSRVSVLDKLGEVLKKDWRNKKDLDEPKTQADDGFPKQTHCSECGQEAELSDYQGMMICEDCYGKK